MSFAFSLNNSISKKVDAENSLGGRLKKSKSALESNLDDDDMIGGNMLNKDLTRSNVELTENEP